MKAFSSRRLDDLSLFILFPILRGFALLHLLIDETRRA
jgi:hypothetical protein